MPKNHDGRELCHFTYADGRRCTLPQFPDDMGLCYHHGDQYRASLQSKEAGRQVSEFLSADILTACDLSRTLSALFSATAQGYLQPKVASSLGYIAQLMLQTQKLAKQEYLEAFDDPWPKVVADGAAFNDPEPEPDEPQSEPQSLSDPAATLPTRDQLSSPILVPDASPSSGTGEADSPITDTDDSSPDARPDLSPPPASCVADGQPQLSACDLPSTSTPAALKKKLPSKYH